MAWNLHAMEQMQLRRHHRVDGAPEICCPHRYQWCDNKKTPDYVCRYDTVKLGYSTDDGKGKRAPASTGIREPPRGRMRGWRQAATKGGAVGTVY